MGFTRQIWAKSGQLFVCKQAETALPIWWGLGVAYDELPHQICTQSG